MSHASRIAAQLRMAAEDPEVDEDLRKECEERLDELEEEEEEGS